MQMFYFAVAMFLLLTLIAGMWRIMRGPSTADRILAAQLFSTTSVAIILLLAQASDNSALQDIALVFALLAAVTAIAFVQRAWPAEEADNDNH